MTIPPNIPAPPPEGVTTPPKTLFSTIDRHTLRGVRGSTAGGATWECLCGASDSTTGSREHARALWLSHVVAAVREWAGGVSPVGRAARALYVEDVNASVSPDLWPDFDSPANAARCIYEDNARAAIAATFEERP